MSASIFWPLILNRNNFRGLWNADTRVEEVSASDGSELRWPNMRKSIRRFARIAWPRLWGKKNEPKPKLFGPDIFRWGGGLPRERVGAKKFGMSVETQGNQTFWRDVPGFFAGISRRCPKSLRKKKSVFNFWPLRNGLPSAVVTCHPLGLGKWVSEPTRAQ